jgi:hypothetical protein
MDSAVRRALKLSGLAVVFAGGVLLAGTVVGGRAADTTGADITITETTTAETTTTAEVTTTEESTTTAEATTTVERTTTRVVRVPTSGTTTETSSTDNGTADWVWVLLGILAVGLVVLIVLLARRGEGEASPTTNAGASSTPSSAAGPPRGGLSRARPPTRPYSAEATNRCSSASTHPAA